MLKYGVIWFSNLTHDFQEIGFLPAVGVWMKIINNINYNIFLHNFIENFYKTL